MKTLFFLNHSHLIFQAPAVVTDRVHEIGFSGNRNQPKNGIKAKLNKAFLPFFAIFEDFFKVPQH